MHRSAMKLIFDIVLDTFRHMLNLVSYLQAFFVAVPKDELLSRALLLVQTLQIWLLPKT